MKVSIYTQIAPRIETFFLKEWIEHHLMVGVDKIFIYNNGFFCKDHYGEGNIWNKKPYLNYFLEYTDSEITDKLESIVDSFKNYVSLVPWETNGSCPKNTRTGCQVWGYKNCVTNNHSDWWLHIDPDEFILSQKYLTIKDFLKATENAEFGRFILPQKIFGIRKQNCSVRGITECDWRTFDTNIPGLTKTLIHNDMKTFDIHRPKLKDSSSLKTKYVDSFDLMYNHYRGIGEPVCSVKEFEEYKLPREDDAMILFLKRHGVFLHNSCSSTTTENGKRKK